MLLDARKAVKLKGYSVMWHLGRGNCLFEQYAEKGGAVKRFLDMKNGPYAAALFDEAW